MFIQTFHFNPYCECTYVISNKESDAHCIIIDCGAYDENEQKQLSDFLQANHLTPVTHLVTHTHPDHICGAEYLEKIFGIEPIIYPEEGLLTLSSEFPKLEVIHTPGHKPDSVCYYFPTEKIIFTGDTLFQESVGRTDLAGGNMDELLKSLQRLMVLPPETVVYPGHGYSTTIAHEQNYNPYI